MCRPLVVTMKACLVWKRLMVLGMTPGRRVHVVMQPVFKNKV